MLIVIGMIFVLFHLFVSIQLSDVRVARFVAVLLLSEIGKDSDRLRSQRTIGIRRVTRPEIPMKKPAIINEVL